MAPSPTGFLHIGGVRTFALQLAVRPARGRRVPAADREHGHEPRGGGGGRPDRGVAALARPRLGRPDSPSSSTGWTTAARSRSGSSPRARRTRTRARSASACPTTASTAWDDVVRGRVEVPNETIEDVVIVRSDGRPTYNFASPMEDVWDGITHVIRAEDHISNTPKQINIIGAVGAELPVYAHVPNVNGADGKKLSKRHGAGRPSTSSGVGLPPGRAAELPRAARLGAGRRDDDHEPRRARRSASTSTGSARARPSSTTRSSTG